MTSNKVPREAEGLELETYSDLEVVSRVSVMIPNEKMALAQADEAAATPETPAPAYAAAVPSAAIVASSAAPMTTSRFMSDNASSVYNPKVEGQPQKKEKKIIGLKKKTFIILALGSALVLITALAVALGVSLGARTDREMPASDTTATRPDSSESEVETDPTDVLPNSNIAAVNWTDTGNIARAAVFYQDASNALSVMLFDSLSGGWMRRNVTASVMNSSSIPALDVLPGTPLACVTNRFQVSLYYLRSDHKVGEVFAYDPVKGDWFPGAMSSILDPQAVEGSSLSAYWQICPSCTNSLLVTYQGIDGVQLANLTNEQWQSMPTITESITPESGLSMSPFTDFDGAGPTGTDANALRIYHSASSNLTEMISGPLTDNRWETGNFGNAVISGLPTSPAPDITSFSFGANGWTNSVATYLTSDNKLISSHWNGKEWRVQPTEIVRGGGNFTAIAATQWQRVFAIVNGTIHQYRIEAAKDPFTWFHVGKVTD